MHGDCSMVKVVEEHDNTKCSKVRQLLTKVTLMAGLKQHAVSRMKVGCTQPPHSNFLPQNLKATPLPALALDIMHYS